MQMKDLGKFKGKKLKSVLHQVHLQRHCTRRGLQVQEQWDKFFPNAPQKGSRFKGWGPGVQAAPKSRCVYVRKRPQAKNAPGLRGKKNVPGLHSKKRARAPQQQKIKVSGLRSQHTRQASIAKKPPQQKTLLPLTDGVHSEPVTLKRHSLCTHGHVRVVGLDPAIRVIEEVTLLEPLRTLDASGWQRIGSSCYVSALDKHVDSFVRASVIPYYSCARCKLMVTCGVC